MSSCPPSVKTARADVVSFGKESFSEEQKMKAKSLISQIQSTLDGASLAQRYIRPLRQTWRALPKSIRDRLKSKERGLRAWQGRDSVRW